jgi:Tfp pilus assembly protein PilN
MLNINFVPDDYIQSTESKRTNLMYLALFAVVMVVLAGSFMTIKIRQRAFAAKEKAVSAKMLAAKEAIKKFEELQTKRKVMIKTALTTAELLEPVPRSVLLASVTNNLPPGVSLLHLKLVQKKPAGAQRSAATSKYQAAQAKKQNQSRPKPSPEKLLETSIDIEGIAPSDLQVASYIEQLTASSLLDNVALVESKRHKRSASSRAPAGHAAEGETFRQFRLTAKLKKEVHLTSEDVEGIKTRGGEAARSFY